MSQLNNAAAIGRLAAMVEEAVGGDRGKALEHPKRDLAAALAEAMKSGMREALAAAAAEVAAFPDTLTTAEQMDAWAAYYERKGSSPEERVRRMIGLQLRAARNACALSQVEAAKKTGVERSVITRIESGVYATSTDTLAALAAGLGTKFVIDF